MNGFTANPTKEQLDAAEKNQKNIQSQIKSRGRDVDDNEYLSAFGITPSTVNTVESTGDGKNIDVEFVDSNNEQETAKTVETKKEDKKVESDNSNDSGESSVGGDNQDKSVASNDVFEGEDWQNLLSNADDNKDASVEQLADNADKSSDGPVMPNILEVAKELGVEYNPSDALDPSTESYRVREEYDIRKQTYLIELNESNRNKRTAKVQEEAKRKELFQKQANKLAEYDPLFKNSDGTPNLKKIMALVSAVSKMEASEDSLVLMRKYHKMSLLNGNGSNSSNGVVKEKEKKEEEKETPGEHFTNVRKLNGLPGAFNVSDEELREINDFFGS